MINQEEKIKESIKLRGICASLQSMSLPTVDNLIDLCKKVDINLIKTNK